LAIVYITRVSAGSPGQPNFYGLMFGHQGPRPAAGTEGQETAEAAYRPLPAGLLPNVSLGIVRRPLRSCPGSRRILGRHRGVRRAAPRDALATLEEAIMVTRLVWSGQRNLRFNGEHYRLAGAYSGPLPAHQIGIWLGVYGPRALRLTSRLADGWVPSLRGEITASVTTSVGLTFKVASARRKTGMRPRRCGGLKRAHR
jgi:hypothetical protein